MATKPHRDFVENQRMVAKIVDEVCGPTDAVGQPLKVGDMVVHVSRHSSSIHINERTVSNVRVVGKDWKGRDEYEVQSVETGKWVTTAYIIKTAKEQA